MWTFKCYIDKEGKNELADWYCSLPEDMRGKVLYRLNYLKMVAKSQWRDPLAEHESGGSPESYEIKFKGKSRTEHRIYGYFIEEEKIFVMCNQGIKKDTKDNKRGFEKAAKRRREIENGERSTVEYDFLFPPDNCAN